MSLKEEVFWRIINNLYFEGARTLPEHAEYNVLSSDNKYVLVLFLSLEIKIVIVTVDF